MLGNQKAWQCALCLEYIVGDKRNFGLALFTNVESITLVKVLVCFIYLEGLMKSTPIFQCFYYCIEQRWIRKMYRD